MSDVKLNLGCGFRKLEGYVNIDNRSETNPDLVCDLIEGIPYDDDSVDEVRAHDFLEHVPIGKTIFMMEEIYRVLKPDGILDVSVPSTQGNGAFMDPTHCSFWNMGSFLYYMADDWRHLYNIKAKFEGELINHMTDQRWIIIHVRGRLRAVKG